MWLAKREMLMTMTREPQKHTHTAVVAKPGRWQTFWQAALVEIYKKLIGLKANGEWQVPTHSPSISAHSNLVLLTCQKNIAD